MDARSLAEDARLRIHQLAAELGSKRAAYDRIARYGVSESLVSKFARGKHGNLSVNTLDTLRRALEIEGV